MKKIVGIFAAAAVLASSAFAVDFSAGFQLKGSLFDYGADGSLSAFNLRHDNAKDDKPFIFSASDDRVGGTLKFYDNAAYTIWNQSKYDAKLAEEKAAGKNDAEAKTEATKAATESINPMVANYWSIWFKPFDSVKVELGNVDTKLNCESITYWRGKVLGGGEWAYKASYEADGLTLALALAPGQGENWFSLPKNGDAALAETDVYAAYSADFGTISALFIGNKTFKDISIGAGYKGTFDSLTFFTDAAFVKSSDATKGNSVVFDVDAKYSQDEITFEAYAKGDTGNLNKVAFSLMAQAKFSYALDGGTFFVKLVDLNALKFVEGDNLNELGVGFDGNLGALSYEVEAKVESKGGKIAFGVPVWFRLGF